jgi:phosphate transport system substrate-binding protein
MAAKSPPPIVYILLAALLVGGGWYAFRKGWLPSKLPLTSGPSPTTSATNPTVATLAPVTPQSTPQAANPVQTASNLDTSVPNPAVISMDGSVTMVKLLKGLQSAYAQKYPNIPTTYGVPDGNPNGSNKGLQGLMSGNLQIAATSRPLNAAEAQAGIQAIPIARDALAIVVGVNNPFKGGLTLQQVSDIYQGKITNWSQVGGENAPIKVLNRSPNSGTADLFKSVVMLGQPFAPDGPNFITFQQDVTTPILRALGSNGIGYTTVAQAENQQTVRILAIDGILPTDRAAVQEGSYPISRSVFLAVPQKTSPAVKDFIDLALSTQGQQIAQRAEFTPLR